MQKKIYKVVVAGELGAVEETMQVRGWKRPTYHARTGVCSKCDRIIFIGEPYFRVNNKDVCLNCCTFQFTGKFRNGKEVYYL